MDEQARQQCLMHYSYTLEYVNCRDYDLVIVAIAEGMEAKKGILQALDSICKAGTSIATNTSSLWLYATQRGHTEGTLPISGKYATFVLSFVAASGGVPRRAKRGFDSVAQLVEHIPFKDGVPGSSPG